MIGPVRRWAARTTSLHGELAGLVDVAPTDPRWWLAAAGVAAAEPWDRASAYVRSDAEPSADTFIGHACAPLADPIADAIARAHAARAAVRELDGRLPDQPLAVTIDRGTAGASATASALDRAAFAIGERCFVATLAARPDDERELARELRVALLGGEPSLARPGDGATPFVTVSLGVDDLAIARHGHRRAWTRERGPWLGLGRTDELATVSTCHMIVDGYGHAWLAARIADHARALAPRVHANAIASVPTPAPVAGAIALGIAWRALPAPAPRALPLAYELGILLRRMLGAPLDRFSPPFQIPVAPGKLDDPARRLRRAVPALASVRFVGDEPEPYAAFEARARDRLAREAQGRGLISRLLAAARAAPTPLAWKRRAVGTTRPRWLEAFAPLLGGRACLSRIRVDPPVPPSCAVSAPAMHASPTDAFGGFVVTVIDDDERAAITVCGSGHVGTHARAAAVLDELVAAGESTVSAVL